MSYVPNSVKKWVVYVIYHAEKVGSIVDPIKILNAHFIKIFDKNIHAVFFGSIK